MAIGFGFNKQRVLAAAEKYVQQGKLNAAIAEYEKIIQKEPRDLTVLNTVGDLYARLGQNERAADYFRRVAETYSADGFTVKAIAMYKKMAKLEPSNLGIVHKLADLFSQQGLVNDARHNYLVLADAYMRRREYDGAVTIFSKMLEMDPENSSLQSKLADLYIRLGRKGEAAGLLLRIAKSLYQAGSKEAAEKTLSRLLEANPSHSEALMLRGKIAAELGHGAAAVKTLESIADIDSRPEGLHSLLKAQLVAGKLEDAEALARKLASAHKDVSGVCLLCEGLLKAGKHERALGMYDEFAGLLLTGDSGEALQLLQSLISHFKESAAGLERLRALLHRAGASANIPEVIELLAHLCVQRGDLAKARDLYKELTELEPSNPAHAQNYRQVMARLGGDATTRPLPATEAEQALFIDELETPHPPLEQAYAAELAEAIQAALTDAELYESYSKAPSAIPGLENVVKRAPQDVRLNQKLGILYAKTGRLQDAVRCWRTLYQVYTQAGRSEEAREFAEMAQRYGGQLSAQAAQPAPSASAVPGPSGALLQTFEVVAAEPAPIVPAGAGEAHEIDLSDEWEAALTDQSAARPAQAAAESARVHPSAISDLLEEIRFYIAQAMRREAVAAMARLEGMAPDAPGIRELKRKLDALPAPVDRPPATRHGRPAAPRPELQPEVISELQEVGFDDIIIEEPEPGSMPAAAPPSPLRARPEPRAAPSTEPTPPPKPAIVRAGVPRHAQRPSTAAVRSGNALDDLVLDLEDALGDDFVPSVAGGQGRQPVGTFAPGHAASAQRPAAGLQRHATAVGASMPTAVGMQIAASQAGDVLSTDDNALLARLFAEFKEEVEDTSTGEDPETHYNLGVAFKEMGLLDEAIGELQKVCFAIERGEAFPRVIQAYTWLAQCFVEKGVPEAGIKWYEKALKVPGDAESRTAIHYELGSAYEAAGAADTALQHFLEVYGSNIDYRDVAERIKALKS